MKRSAIAFARGARIGVLIIRVSIHGEHGIESGGELRVTVAGALTPDPRRPAAGRGPPALEVLRWG